MILKFNIFGKAVTIQSSKLDQTTQRAAGWKDEAVSATSGFYNNIAAKIATEISKVNFQHVKYKKTPNGIDTLTSMDGSDIDEVLNWKPKGHLNSVEFWSIVARKLMRTRQIYLDPVYDSDGQLIDLLLADDDIDTNETVNIVSPFFFNLNTSILDATLSSIATKLQQGRIKGQLKINGVVDTDSKEFVEKAQEMLNQMQKIGSVNGLTVTDSKTEINEFSNSYSVLNDEEIKLIKSELLSSYFMSEKILTGEASQVEQIYFYQSTIIPLLNQLEKELTYKLISSSKRQKVKGNIYYERIIIDNQLFKFASIKDMLDLYHENTQAPMLTVNEFKVLMGLEPIEGGDVYLTNLNSKIIKSFSELQEETKEGEETS